MKLSWFDNKLITFFIFFLSKILIAICDFQAFLNIQQSKKFCWKMWMAEMVNSMKTKSISKSVENEFVSENSSSIQ